MRSRFIQMVILALVFVFAPPAAAEGEKDAFRAAYKAYQAAVEAKDVEAMVTTAGEALELGKSVFPDDSPSLAALHINYGMALVDAGTGNTGAYPRTASQAIAPLREGIKRYEILYGKNDERLIAPLWSLADSYRAEVPRDGDATDVYKRVLKLVTDVHGKNSLLFAEINLAIGRSFYVSFYEQKRAFHYFEKAYEAFENYYGQPAYKTGVAALWLGKSAEQRRSRRKAEDYYLTALQIFEETVPPGHELQLMAHTHLIKLYEDRGKSDEATLHCQAISRLRPLVGVDGFTPLYKKHPSYPRNAQRAGRDGYVLVEFSVTAIGTVANASVIESEGGKDFERAALKAVEGFRYAPAVQDGVLIETKGVRNLISFQIAD